jgi:hypothetical protein
MMLFLRALVQRHGAPFDARATAAAEALRGVALRTEQSRLVLVTHIAELIQTA